MARRHAPQVSRPLSAYGEVKRSSRLVEKEARERSEREAIERARLEEEAAKRERLRALSGYSPMTESRRVDDEDGGVTEREKRILARSEKRILDAAREIQEAEKEAEVAAIAEQYQMQGASTEDASGKPKSPLRIILRRQDEGKYDSALVDAASTEDLQRGFTCSHPCGDSTSESLSSSASPPKDAAVSKAETDRPQEPEKTVRKEDAKLLTDFSAELAAPQAALNHPTASSGQISLNGPINPP